MKSGLLVVSEQQGHKVTFENGSFLDFSSLGDAQLNLMGSLYTSESIGRLNAANHNKDIEMKMLMEKVSILESRVVEVDKLHEVVAGMKNKMVTLKDEVRVDSRDKKEMQAKALRRVYVVLAMDKHLNYFKEKDSDTVKTVYRKVIARLWRDVKNQYNVNTYEDIKREDFEDAMDTISNWTPKHY